MAIYLGYYRATPEFAEETRSRARREGLAAALDPTFLQRVRELPEQVPAGCRLIGSYVPMGGGGVLATVGLPAVMIGEPAAREHLRFITTYSPGSLLYQWTPAPAPGPPRQEREAWAASVAAPAGARP